MANKTFNPTPSRLLSAAAVLIATFLPSALLACTCQRLTVQQARDQADIVFVGKVESIVAIDPLSEWEPRVIARFRVSRVWKGPVGETFEMHTNFEASSCGGFFDEVLKENATLLVYGVGRPASTWKRNGVDGAPNAASLTVIPSVSAPLRADLLKALPDQQMVYTTNICTRTMPVEAAAEDFKALGKATELAGEDGSPHRRRQAGADMEADI